MLKKHKKHHPNLHFSIRGGLLFEKESPESGFKRLGTGLSGSFEFSRQQWYEIPLHEDVREQVMPLLAKSVRDRDEREAVSRLLNLVQTGFEYEYDEKVWGHDRPFFAEETLYYPFCDCEDRAILLSRLVRDLLGLRTLLVFYPGHLAMAVAFNEKVEGDYIVCQGLRFVVCDPTYIGAPVGATMTGMDNAKATVVLLEP